MSVGNATIDVSIHFTKLSITVQGCFDNITDTLDNVLDWYYNTNTINIDTYKIVYHDIMTNLINWQYSPPFSMIATSFKKMLNPENVFSNQQMINSLTKLDLAKVNLEKFVKNIKKYLSYGKIIAVFGGSIDTEHVYDIIHMLERKVDVPKIEVPSVKYSLNPVSFTKKHVEKHINHNNTENAIGYGLYIGNMMEKLDDFKTYDDLWMFNKLFCMILEKFTSEKFATQVRTEKEVGYIANAKICNISEINNSELYLLFMTQSSRTDLEDIVVDYVDNHMLKDIKSMTDAEYEDVKHSITIKISEKPVNIYDDVYDKYEQILHQCNDPIIDYNRKKLLLDSLEMTNKKMFVDFARRIFARNIRSIVIINNSQL